MQMRFARGKPSAIIALYDAPLFFFYGISFITLLSLNRTRQNDSDDRHITYIYISASAVRPSINNRRNMRYIHTTDLLVLATITAWKNSHRV